MDINPSYDSIGRIINQGIYEVPKYQRNYAWETDQLEDFFNDIEKCYTARVSGSSKIHFFGGIVSVKGEIDGTVELHRYQLVDGQQRMATFVLLLNSMIHIFEELHERAQGAGNQTTLELLADTIPNLKERFREKDLVINMRNKTFNRLEMSGPDNHFFQELVRGREEPTDGRASRERIKEAYDYIYHRLSELISNIGSLSQKAQALGRFRHIVDEDCRVINIVTDERKYAYELFQVLNDRGIQLTVGDLLRAKALELLEDHNAKQDASEKAWDEILRDQAGKTKNYLSWTNSLLSGDRPVQSSLFDDCLEAFYPQHKNGTITSQDARDILSTTKVIQEEVRYCRKLSSGEWPYQDSNTRQIEKNKLRLLIVELGNTSCTPFFLGARNLDESDFASLVDLTLRFFFKYKTIGGGHATPILNLFAEHGHDIKSSPGAYNIENYRSALRGIMDQSGPEDEEFAEGVRGLKYKPRGRNTKLKFFLMMVEHYHKWFESGQAGEPRILDTIVYDFPNTDIEHIYPQNARDEDVSEEKEEIKHEIGNLTILGPDDNRELSNKSFGEKRSVLQESKVRMNSTIGDEQSWSVEDIQEREKTLIEMAKAIFHV